MPSGPCRFTKVDLARVFAAAKFAGVRLSHVEVTRDGGIIRAFPHYDDPAPKPVRRQLDKVKVG